MSGRRYVVAFVGPDGQVRELKDPHLGATGRQLRWLNERGLLQLRDVPGIPIAKGVAAAKISEENEAAA